MRKGRFPADPPLVTSFSRDEGLTHLLFRAAVAERLKVFVENGEQAVGFRVVDARERREADDGPVFNGGGRNEPACGPEDALQMLERERVGRMKEGEYVRATRILLETGLEAESDHAGGELFGSRATGRLAHGGAALLVESVQRGMQGGDGLRRQGVFDAGFLPAQAFEEVERDAARPSFGRLENVAAGQHEGEAGDAFEAAVRDREEHVDAERFRVDACGAEGDACVDDERPALRPDGTADFPEVVPEE